MSCPHSARLLCSSTLAARRAQGQSMSQSAKSATITCQASICQDLVLRFLMCLLPPPQLTRSSPRVRPQLTCRASRPHVLILRIPGVAVNKIFAFPALLLVSSWRSIPRSLISWQAVLGWRHGALDGVRGCSLAVSCCILHAGVAVVGAACLQAVGAAVTSTLEGPAGRGQRVWGQASDASQMCSCRVHTTRGRLQTSTTAKASSGMHVAFTTGCHMYARPAKPTMQSTCKKGWTGHLCHPQALCGLGAGQPLDWRAFIPPLPWTDTTSRQDGTGQQAHPIHYLCTLSLHVDPWLTMHRHAQASGSIQGLPPCSLSLQYTSSVSTTCKLCYMQEVQIRGFLRDLHHQSLPRNSTCTAPTLRTHKSKRSNRGQHSHPDACVNASLSWQ